MNEVWFRAQASNQGFKRASTAPITWAVDTFGVALSGLHSAERLLEATAHNVANLSTEGARPLEVVQQERPTGGSIARIDQAESPRPVDHIEEVVNQLQARHQYTASLRILMFEDDLRGHLADVFA